MTLATKAELRTDVGNWLNRASDANFLAQFDSFLTLAEAEFGTRLRADVMERRLRATLNERWETNPAGTNQISSISIVSNGAYQDGGPLDFIIYQEVIKRFGESAGASTRVCAYTLVGEQIGFFPFPEEDLTSTLEFEIVAYARPAALVAEDSTNLVLTTYPGIYLYGVLMQTALYYGRDEDFIKWDQSYEKAIADANEEAASTPGDILIQRVG